MKAGLLNLELTQRDDYSNTITFTTSAGAVINYSASTFTGWIRGVNARDEPIAFTCDGTNLNVGVLVISLTKAQTVRLPRQCTWELRRTVTATAAVITVLQGQATVSPKVMV